METLAGIAMKKRVDEKLAPFGFLKKDNDGTNKEESNDS